MYLCGACRGIEQHCSEWSCKYNPRPMCGASPEQHQRLRVPPREGSGPRAPQHCCLHEARAGERRGCPGSCCVTPPSPCRLADGARFKLLMARKILVSVCETQVPGLEPRALTRERLTPDRLGVMEVHVADFITVDTGCFTSWLCSLTTQPLLPAPGV